MLPMFRRPNYTQFDYNNVDQCRDENFQNKVVKILL